MTKMVDQTAKSEKSKDDTCGNDCNDSLALLSYACRQISYARKDFLPSELNCVYNHFCSHSMPVAGYLFGDDVSKSAKGIGDSTKITKQDFTMM